MTGKNLKDLLTFASFRPEPEDWTAPWSHRFSHRRSLLLNINKNTIRWQILLKGGHYGDAGIEEGSLDEVLQNLSDEWKTMTDDAWCSVSVNNRFILSLESNLSRKKGYADMLRSNPKSILGSKYERGKTYAIHHHPETNASLLLAVEETLIKEIQDTLKKYGLRTGRLSCGLFAMVSDVLHRIHSSSSERSKKASESEPLAPSNYLLIACCEGSVCVLKQRDHQWSELRSRPAYYQTNDLTPIAQILQPMLGDWDPTFPVIFVSENKDVIHQDQLRHVFPGCPINDISVPQQLWSILGKQ